MVINQYTIVLVDLEPTRGNEINKTRPCAVASPNEMNHYLNTVVVVPMTTNLKKYPSRVAVDHNGKKGMLVLDQIRTVDKSRVIKILDTLTKSEITECKKVLSKIYVK